MAAWRRVLGGLIALFRRSRLDEELDEELQHYLESGVEDRRRAGMSEESAWRAARARLGSIDAVKDHTRDAGWETALEQFWRDVCYAARTLRRSPVFSAVVVLTLALGIGANTAIFSAVNAVMLRALAAERPEELVSIAAIYPGGAEPFSYPAFRRLAADGAHLVDALAASPTQREAIVVDGPPQVVELKWVSGNYFVALGVSTAAGRPLLPADDLQPPGEAVAVISHSYWSRRFGRDPAVVGRAIRLRGTTFTIVGVARGGFASETPGEIVDLWLPLSAQPNAPAWLWTGHSTTWLSVLARLRPAVNRVEAGAGLQPIYDAIRSEIAADTDSADFRQAVLASRLTVSEARGGAPRLRDRLATPLAILMAIVLLVLLVACANLANLMLTRAVARRRELAMRLALGAGRTRLVRQATLEAWMLAMAGAAVGCALAFWGTSALSSLLAGVLPVALDIRPDTRVLMFAGLSACGTAVLFGLLPALATARLDPLGALRRGGSGRGASRIPFGRTLVIAQVAVSLVLVVAAGLFVRSVMALSHEELGFDPAQMVLFRIRHSLATPLPDATRHAIDRQVLAHAAGVPGVSGASGSRTGLLSPDTWRNVIAVEGAAPTERPLRSQVNAVTPGYFAVTRIAVVRGRGFTDQDREGAAGVAVVSEAFARRFLGAHPLGRRVGLCASESCEASSTRMMEVVGVAEDAKYSSVDAPAPPLLYLPLGQSRQALGEIQVRASGEVSAIAATLYRTISGVDPRLSVVGMTTARERVDASLAIQHAVARISSTFGLLALVIAGVGLFGLVAYTTAGRAQEIGVRMALGARGQDVQRLVLGDAFRLVAIGAGLGLPAALALTRVMASLLYQTEPHDPGVFSISLAVLGVVALLAGSVPAARAARVDPVTALRED